MTETVKRHELPLNPGDHLDQPTFHRLYEAMPPGIKAELVQGTVTMPSPTYLRHGEPHAEVIMWLGHYKARTPGVRLADNTTSILGPHAEVQPDAALFLDLRSGGRTPVTDDCIAGAPELVVEVAVSSADHDLGAKLLDYQRAGVQEYVVPVIGEGRVRWFVLEADRFVELAPGPDGLFRSRVFPGLWLDPDALVRLDSAAVAEAAARGLASPEHAEFVRRLKDRT
jgi:Uma2 family endonuclease